MVLLDKRGFTAEDFAALHPGGAIGKVLIKVHQIMHTGEEIPRVHADTSFSQMVLEITAKRLGVTTVVNGDDHLLGIITDGDLRRAIEKEIMLEKLKAADVMTKNPRTITKNRLAIEALNRMEKHKITSLVVTEGNRKVVGLLHMHDILQAKVV
jgi:arabinose-5-phosphate isomerase